MARCDNGTRRLSLGAFLSLLDRSLAVMCSACTGLGAVLVLLMGGVVGYSVVLRYVFNQPQVWTDELVGYWLVLVVMFGAADVLRRGSHIGIDLVTEHMSPRVRRWSEIWGLTAVAFVSIILFASGWEMVAFSLKVDLVSEGYLEMPMWIPQTAVPAGSVLLCIAALHRMLLVLRTPASGDSRQ